MGRVVVTEFVSVDGVIQESRLELVDATPLEDGVFVLPYRSAADRNSDEH